MDGSKENVYHDVMDGVIIYQAGNCIKEIPKERKLALGLDGRSKNRRFVLKIRWNRQFATKAVDRELFLKGRKFKRNEANFEGKNWEIG